MSCVEVPTSSAVTYCPLTGRDGYFDNVLTGEENADGVSDRSLRLQLQLTPSSNFESSLLLGYTLSKDDCGDCVQTIKGYNPANPKLLGQGSLDVNDLNRTINQEIFGGFERPTYTGIWTNALDLGSVTLTSITGYTRLRTFLSIDFNRAPGPLTLAPGLSITEAQSFIRSRTGSQEVRLASNGDNAFDWLIGAYYYELNERNRSTVATTVPGLVLPVGNQRSRVVNYAVFANGSIELTPRLELGVGLRYDYERTNLLDVATAARGRAKSTELLPRMSLTYAIDDDTNLYGTVSRGYHSGGVNGRSATFGDPPEPNYGPEFVWNYEIGLKGGSRRTVSYDVAAFYIDWTDQQVTSTNGLLNYIVNAGKTRIYGLEGTVQAKLSERFTVDVAAAYTNARFRDFLDQSGVPVFFGVPAQRRGERPLLAPDFSATI